MKEYKMLAPVIEEYTGVITPSTYRFQVTDGDSVYIETISADTHEVINIEKVKQCY